MFGGMLAAYVFDEMLTWRAWCWSHGLMVLPGIRRALRLSGLGRSVAWPDGATLISLSVLFGFLQVLCVAAGGLLLLLLDDAERLVWSPAEPNYYLCWFSGACGLLGSSAMLTVFCSLMGFFVGLLLGGRGCLTKLVDLLSSEVDSGLFWYDFLGCHINLLVFPARFFYSAMSGIYAASQQC